VARSVAVSGTQRLGPLICSPDDGGARPLHFATSRAPDIDLGRLAIGDYQSDSTRRAIGHVDGCGRDSTLVICADVPGPRRVF
jgi:hypothetical protein